MWRTLSYDDVSHYGKIVVALKETMRLMGELDDLLPRAGSTGGRGGANSEAV